MSNDELVDAIIDNIQNMPPTELRAFFQAGLSISECFTSDKQTMGVLILVRDSKLNLFSFNADFPEAGNMTMVAAQHFKTVFQDMELAREHAH